MVDYKAMREKLIAHEDKCSATFEEWVRWCLALCAVDAAIEKQEKKK